MLKNLTTFAPNFLIGESLGADGDRAAEFAIRESGHAHPIGAIEIAAGALDLQGAESRLAPARARCYSGVLDSNCFAYNFLKNPLSLEKSTLFQIEKPNTKFQNQKVLVKIYAKF